MHVARGPVTLISQLGVAKRERLILSSPTRREPHEPSIRHWNRVLTAVEQSDSLTSTALGLVITILLGKQLHPIFGGRSFGEEKGCHTTRVSNGSAALGH